MRLGKMAIGLAMTMMASGASAQETIDIGLSTPLTGPVAYGSLHERRGIELALEEINAAGGILGKEVRVITEDNQCNPGVSVTVANRLIEQGVVAVMGAQCSSAVLAAMPVFMKARIPLVSAIASSPEISEKSGVGGNPWVFRLNPSDKELAAANVNYLASLGTVKTIAIVAESTDYGRGGADAFSAAAKAKGFEIVSTDFHPIGAADFTTIITRLKSTGADAVALYNSVTDIANFGKQAQAQGLKTIMTGKLSFGGDALQALLAAGAFDGAITGFPYNSQVDLPENKAFDEKVAQKFGEGAVLQSFAGYEATYVLTDAIERAGSTDGDAIRQALKDTSYKSIMGGVVEFDDHNQAHNNAVISVVDGTEEKVVDVFPTD